MNVTRCETCGQPVAIEDESLPEGEPGYDKLAEHTLWRHPTPVQRLESLQQLVELATRARDAAVDPARGLEVALSCREIQRAAMLVGAHWDP